MYSKKYLFFSLIFILFSISACSLKFGDEPSALNAKIASGRCLSDLSGSFDKYVDGSLNESKISETSKCLISALEEFNYVSRKGDGFKPEELVTFLNKKVFDEPRISRNLTKELMKIKVLFVGGTENYVRTDDFKKLIEFIRFIEDQAKANLKYIRIYRKQLSREERDKLSLEDVRQAKLQLRRTAYAMADWIRGSQITYDFESLEQLIRELRILVNFNHRTMVDSIDQWVELIRHFKLIAVAGSQAEIEPKIWVSLLGTIAEVYGVYLDSVYFLSKPFYIGDGFEALKNSAVKVFAALESGIRNQSNQILSYKLLDGLLEAMSGLNFIPASVQIEGSVRPLIRHIGSVTFRAPGSKLKSIPEGLTLQNLGQMRGEFNNWAASQDYLLKVKEYVDLKKLNLDFAEVAALAEKDGLKPHPSIQYLNQMTVRFIENAEGLRMRTASDKFEPQNAKRGFKSMTVLNAIRSAGRVLVRTGATDDNRYHGMIGLTEAEAESIYQVIKGIMSDLDILDKYDGMGAKAFKEANLFTFSGNGLQDGLLARTDALVTLQEIIEQLSSIYSGYGVRNAILGRIEKYPTCLKGEFYNVGCLKKVLREEYVAILWNFPQMQKMLVAAEPNYREEFFSVLWEMSADECADPKFAAKADILKFSTVLHYIEAVFATYDLNMDGVLSGREVMRAFPRFHIVLDREVEEREGDRKDVGMLKSIFAFLVSRGSLPDSLLDKWQLLKWDGVYFDDEPDQYLTDPKADVFPMRVDRLRLTRVFRFLQSSSSSTCPTNVRKNLSH